ncbi:MAG: protein-glutamate O-methyltransferase CheR [Bacteroidetes bacterium]|nr:protein-glutamate O-methyltransferase CheR [Bacteroidota bacterium]
MAEEIYFTDVKLINQTILNKYNIDFSGMASTSYRRRLLKAMNANAVDTVAALVGKLESNEAFFKRFCCDMIVDSTELFRDPSFWRKIKEEVFPRYVSQASIRIWLVGCASGEELISLCIALKEMGLLNKSKILTTEINDSGFNKVKNAIYPIKNMEISLSNYERFEGKGKLNDYYKEENGTAVFDKSLLSTVTFKPNHFGKEEVGSSFDIVFCRNNFIYTNSALQDSALNIIQKSLFKGGFLAIGIKEDISNSMDYSNFQVVSQEEKIFIKK